MTARDTSRAKKRTARGQKRHVTVYFAEARMKKAEASYSLPAKFQRLLKRVRVSRDVKGKNVAVKMHLGGGIGYTTIHPLFVRILVSVLKEAGARSVKVMDGTIAGAQARGYTQEVLGCPVVSCFGATGKYYYREKIGFAAKFSYLF